MKKITLLAITFVLTLSLCACRMGGNDQTADPTDNTTLPATEPSNAPTNAPTNPTRPSVTDPTTDSVFPDGNTPVG